MTVLGRSPTASGGGLNAGSGARDPTSTDDAAATPAMAAGSIWTNTLTRSKWICHDATATAAIWYRISLDLFAGYKSGRFYGPHRSLLSSSAMVADLMYACLIRIRERVTLSQLGLNISATGTATFAKLALFDSTNGAGGLVPNNKLVELNTPVAVNSVTTEFGALASNPTIDEGLYWGVALFNGTVTPITVSSADQLVSQELGGAAANDVLNTSAQMTGWTGVPSGGNYAGGFASPFGTPTARLAHMPAVGFKVA